MREHIPGLKRPKTPIRTPQKMTLAILCLIFGALFAFVFAEERQRGIALIIAVPFALCLVYFSYLWLKDHEALQRYRKYRQDLLDAVRKEYPDYGLKKEQTFDPSTGKDLLGIIAIFDLIITIVLTVEASNRRIALLTGVIFVILIMLYAYIDNYESKEVEKEIGEIEAKISSSECKAGGEKTTV